METAIVKNGLWRNYFAPHYNAPLAQEEFFVYIAGFARPLTAALYGGLYGKQRS
jgi:hypothetical protein